MHRMFLSGIALALAACGTDIPNDRTAAVARENVAARDAAQEGRILNPEALACVRANATEAEWAVIASETEDAPQILADVLNREGTARCFSVNNVVIYI